MGLLHRRRNDELGAFIVRDHEANIIRGRHKAFLAAREALSYVVHRKRRENLRNGQ